MRSVGVAFDFDGNGMMNYHEWKRCLKMMGGLKQYDRNYLMSKRYGGAQPGMMGYNMGGYGQGYGGNMKMKKMKKMITQMKSFIK